MLMWLKEINPNWPRLCGAMLAVLIARPAMGEVPGMFDPASPSAESIRGLFIFVLAITGVIFVLVGGAMAVFIWRFRERPEQADTEPPQLYGSHPIELAWTVAPLITVLVIALVVVRSVLEMRAEEPGEHAIQVRVIGHQWWWEYEYVESGVVTANELVVPLSDSDNPQTIHLQLESADVIHSFWVPQLAGKTDLIPGRVNRMEFVPTRLGTFTGQCAEYCGTQHANMLLRVNVVTPEEYAIWLEQQKQPAALVEGSAGQQRFMELACFNCHTIRGTRAKGKFGPDLTHLMSRQMLASGMIPNDHQNLLDWLLDPQDIKPGCRMPNMRLKPEDAEHLAKYLETLK